MTILTASSRLSETIRRVASSPSTLPAHHTHTVGQLVANRGCVGHYAQMDDDFENMPHATALDAPTSSGTSRCTARRTGSQPGALAHLRVYPDDQIVVAVR